MVGFTGETEWDTTKPDGTPQKLLDVSKLAEAGWTSKIGLQEGLERTVAWYREHVGSAARVGARAFGTSCCSACTTASNERVAHAIEQAGVALPD